MCTNEWENILDENERVVWQGQPSGGTAQGLAMQKRYLLGVGKLCLIACFLFSFTLIDDTMKGFERLILGGIFLAFCVLLLFANILWHMSRHATSFYTLTNTHAYIGAYPFGFRVLEHFKLTPEMSLRQDENTWCGQATYSLVLKSGVRPGVSNPLADKGFLFVASNSGLQEAFEALPLSKHE